MKLKTGAFLALMSLAGVANAEIVNGDWLAGDNKAALDTTTNLLWLDLSETVGYSVNGALAQTNGGVFDGWRLPTENEVRALYGNMFPSLSFNEAGITFHSNQYALTSPMIDIFGFSYSDGSYQHAQGVYLLEGSSTETGVGLFMRELSGSTQGNVAIGLTGSGADYSSGNYSVFLIKDSESEEAVPNADVSSPLPLSVLLMSGLLFASRRQS